MLSPSNGVMSHKALSAGGGVGHVHWQPTARGHTSHKALSAGGGVGQRTRAPDDWPRLGVTKPCQRAEVSDQRGELRDAHCVQVTKPCQRAEVSDRKRRRCWRQGFDVTKPCQRAEVSDIRTAHQPLRGSEVTKPCQRAEVSDSPLRKPRYDWAAKGILVKRVQMVVNLVQKTWSKIYI